MIDRCYLEITNICNLSCVFCPKNKREKRRMTVAQFEALTDALRGQVRFLYLHLMGEPFLHPDLDLFVRRAKDKGFVPIVTTNGTLLPPASPVPPAYKYQISLHSHEGNGKTTPEAYISRVMGFAKAAAALGSIVVLRLWNEGGYDATNDEILRLLAEHVPQPWTERPDGYRLAENLYLEYDKMFEWPDDAAAEKGEDIFCYALRNQIGVLVDGSVVPCCLDHDGDLTLGNLFDQSLDVILASPRARAIYDGFSRHLAVESLCKKCGYAAQTKRFRS